MRCGCSTPGNGLRSSERSQLKTVVFAPMPTAMVRIATAAKPGLLRKLRSVYRKSWSNSDVTLHPPCSYRRPFTTSPHLRAHPAPLYLAILLPSRKGSELSIPSCYHIESGSWWAGDVRNLNMVSGNGQRSEKTLLLPRTGETQQPTHKTRCQQRSRPLGWLLITITLTILRRRIACKGGVLASNRHNRPSLITFNRGPIAPQASISMASPFLPTRDAVQPRILLASAAQKLFWRRWGFANE